MHSALKHQDKPLYEYIRKGETIERELRSVVIHELVLNSFSGNEMDITVRCSKGTYIRTLAEDIGAALGCGAHLTGLPDGKLCLYGPQGFIGTGLLQGRRLAPERLLSEVAKQAAKLAVS